MVVSPNENILNSPGVPLIVRVSGVLGPHVSGPRFQFEDV